MDMNSEICERCAKINFERMFDEADKFFTGDFPLLPPPHSGTQAERDHAWSQEIANPTVTLPVNSEGLFDGGKATCPICEFFKGLTSIQYYNSKPYIDYDHINFYSSLRLCSSTFDISKLSNSCQAHCVDRCFLSVSPSVIIPKYLFDRDFLQSISLGYVVFRALGNHETAQARIRDGIWGRVVPEWIDFKLPKNWLEFCGRHHTLSCCRPKPNNQLQGFRLIDCYSNPIRIEPSTIGTDYVALSYVWAASPETSNTLPNVVLDAIEVTKQLGFQYLWIDPYCIKQNNDKEKAQLIANMHLIFQHAEVTLVAAANGLDGLRGVRRDCSSTQVGRRVQKNLQIRDMTLVTLVDSDETIQQSDWSRRGWTFQEALLSRRVLVFTDIQLYWNCCGMSEMESLYIPAEISHLPDMSQQGRWMAPGIFDRAGKGSVRNIPESNSLTIGLESNENVIKKIHQEVLSDIGQYTCRQLTYDSDALDAFKGIMQMHRARAGNDITFILGLPVIKYSSWDLNSAFAHSLCWCLDGRHRERRNNLLPSWSWPRWK